MTQLIKITVFIFPCRHWQDLGYLIIYITGRPDMQKQRVVSWLSQHNFPHGMIFFSEGLVHDPLRQKTIFLRNLIQEVQPVTLTLTEQLICIVHHVKHAVLCSTVSSLLLTLVLYLCCIEMPRTHRHTRPTDCFLSYQCHIKINSAYGSMKDISVYNMLGLSPSQIYIVGRPSKKYQNQCQVIQFPFASFISLLSATSYSFRLPAHGFSLLH